MMGKINLPSVDRGTPGNTQSGSSGPSFPLDIPLLQLAEAALKQTKSKTGRNYFFDGRPHGVTHTFSLVTREELTPFATDLFHKEPVRRTNPVAVLILSLGMRVPEGTRLDRWGVHEAVDALLAVELRADRIVAGNQGDTDTDASNLGNFYYEHVPVGRDDEGLFVFFEHDEVVTSHCARAVEKWQRPSFGMLGGSALADFAQLAGGDGSVLGADEQDVFHVNGVKLFNTRTLWDPETQKHYSKDDSIVSLLAVTNKMSPEVILLTNPWAYKAGDLRVLQRFGAPGIWYDKESEMKTGFGENSKCFHQDADSELSPENREARGAAGNIILVTGENVQNADGLINEVVPTRMALGLRKEDVPRYSFFFAKAGGKAKAKALPKSKARSLGGIHNVFLTRVPQNGGRSSTLDTLSFFLNQGPDEKANFATYDAFSQKQKELINLCSGESQNHPLQILGRALYAVSAHEVAATFGFLQRLGKESDVPQLGAAECKKGSSGGTTSATSTLPPLLRCDLVALIAAAFITADKGILSASSSPLTTFLRIGFALVPLIRHYPRSYAVEFVVRVPQFGPGIRKPLVQTATKYVLTPLPTFANNQGSVRPLRSAFEKHGGRGEPGGLYLVSGGASYMNYMLVRQGLTTDMLVEVPSGADSKERNRAALAKMCKVLTLRLPDVNTESTTKFATEALKLLPAAFYDADIVIEGELST